MRQAAHKSRAIAPASEQRERERPRPPGAVVGVLDSAEQARHAIDRLEHSGFDASKLSVIGRELPSADHQIGIAVIGVHANVWGRHGALWKRLAEAPAAMALAWVPYIGHVVAIGPAACALAGSSWVARAGPQASALERILSLTGLPAGKVRCYEDAVRAGRFLLLVHGDPSDAAAALRVLGGGEL